MQETRQCLGHVYDSSPKSDWCLGGSIKGECIRSQTGSWEEKKRHSVNTEELKNTIIGKDRRWVWRSESFGGIAADVVWKVTISIQSRWVCWAKPLTSQCLLDFGTTISFRCIDYFNIMWMSYFISLSQIVCISWAGSGWWVRYSVLG